MERTISAMIGKGSVNHNTRAFTAKNVDKNRSADNVEFCQEDIKHVYHKLFDEARERYNAKQKRKDRMIDNYYEKIRRGKQEKLFHEVIFQIGNKDDMNAKNEDGLLAKRILTEFMDEFQARNPSLYVFSAHLHMDEETPHLHIDFVPYITGSKRGLDTRVSLKSALAAEGLKAGGVGLNLVSADTAIIYDPWWNPAIEKQAEDRIYRIGQKNKVTIFKLIATNTIEEKVQTLQETKKRLFDEVLQDHDVPHNISMEDIRYLLN